MKDRQAMNELGYTLDKPMDNQYQVNRGEPVQDTILSLVVGGLMAIAFILGLIVCVAGLWRMIFGKK